VSPANKRVHIAAEVAHGERSLRAARELVRVDLLNDAVSRAHYAAFHFARALLLTEDVEPRSHGGVGSMVGLHFIVSGRLDPERAKDLARLEQFRTEADYNRFFVLTPDGAAEEVVVAARFCAEAREVLRKDGWLGEDV
jgi:uncharacterized protein (UPF0332 family)